MNRFALCSTSIVTPDGVKAGAVIIDGERISAVVHSDHDDYTALGDRMPVTDYGSLAILPGIVDSHVHVNEPGRTEWEGWATATRASLAGGITTIVDMPLNSSPVTTSVEALAAKREAAASSSVEHEINREFWAGLVPGMTAETITALAAAGVRGFKCFMCDSGIDEFPAMSVDDLAEAMRAIAATGLPLLAHAEIVPGDGSAPAWDGSDRSHAAWAATRPASFEHEAVRELVELAIVTGCRVHVVHVSSAQSIELLRDGMRSAAEHAAVAVPVDVAEDESSGPRRGYATFNSDLITYETCPHYLLLAAEGVPDGATQFKCAPPLRSAAEIETLWQHVLRDVPAIVSDHSPAPSELKELESGSFAAAWGGVSSLGLQLPLIATALHERGLERDPLLLFLATALCQRPAELAGLTPERGAIIPGAAADLAIFDLDDEWTISGADAGWRWRLTPYEGRPVRGRVQATYVNGAARFVRA